MSIIQTIREKGAVITITVLAIALIGFILMDSGRTGLFGGGVPTVIGEVNGEDIEVNEFNNKVMEIEQQYPNTTGSQRNQIVETVWEQMVAEKIVEDQFEKLGITFTPREMSAVMFSDAAPQQLKQAFTNPETGEYDVEQAKQWWAQTKSNRNEEQRNAIVSQIIEPMRLNSLYTKYTSMLAASVYQPKWVKEKVAEETNTAAEISYVAVPFSVVGDSAVKVTDSDIKNYLQKHKGEYEQDGGLRISYVSFSAAPNSADSARVENAVSELKPAFEADTNALFFLGRNASVIPYFNGYTPADQIQVPFADSIKALPVGGVFGPYLDGKNYVLAKKVDAKVLPDSVRVRHILLGTIDPQTQQPLLPDTAAARLADSISAAIAGGASFNELEQKYSTDMAAKQQNGVMTFDILTIQSEGFAREFGDFILNSNGLAKDVVKTQFGYHYIEILERINPGPAYKIAYLAREIVPGDETINDANTAAVKLSGNANSVASFQKYAADNGLTVIDVPGVVAENDYQLGGLDDARQIVKWAFEAKEGDVSSPFTVKDNFVVAIVNKKIEAGLPSVEEARPMVETFVRNHKKAAQIIDKLNKPASLEAASKVYGTPVLTTGEDSTLTFQAQIINGIGNEPKIAGAAFHKEFQTRVSPPIEGNTGVFVIKTNRIFKKEPLPEEVLKQQAAARLNATIQSVVGQSFESLKKAANVKDYRSTFY